MTGERERAGADRRRLRALAGVDGATSFVRALVAGLLVRYVPARQERSAWTGVGAVLGTAGWIGASLVFGCYATSIASYQSVFGGFATAIVLMTYLDVVCIVFLARGPRAGAA